MILVLASSGACSAREAEQTSTIDSPAMTSADKPSADKPSADKPRADNPNADNPSGGSADKAAASGAAGKAGAASSVLPSSMQAGAGQASGGSAGISGAAGLGAAGQASQLPADDDADAGVSDGSAMDVTVIAESSFAHPAPTLTIDGASCAAGRCTLAAPTDGKLKVALTLEHNSSSDPMPVLARWKGCGTPSTTFFPVTPSGTSYVLNYETQFSDLRAGSTCTAEIVQGAWLIFAGNMSLKVTAGQDYCTILQVSEMGINASCFPPPATTITVQSDLTPRFT